MYGTEKGDGEHQRSPAAGDEERQVHPRLPDYPQDAETGKSKACHFGQQHTATDVSTLEWSTNISSVCVAVQCGEWGSTISECVM